MEVNNNNFTLENINYADFNDIEINVINNFENLLNDERINDKSLKGISTKWENEMHSTLCNLNILFGEKNQKLLTNLLYKIFTKVSEYRMIYATCLEIITNLVLEKNYPINKAIDFLFYRQINAVSDIHEHIEILAKYANECNSVVELGMRSGISTCAFMKGLFKNNEQTKNLISVDLNCCENINYIGDLATKTKIKFKFIMSNDLHIDLPSSDLTFIDTWHVYAQLKRELEKYAPKTNKYIILHDTTTDEFDGESIRMGWDTKKQSQESGFSEQEIRKGLWPAVEEFLERNNNWILEKRYTNNNGLTILKRKN